MRDFKDLQWFGDDRSRAVYRDRLATFIQDVDKAQAKMSCDQLRHVQLVLQQLQAAGANVDVELMLSLGRTLYHLRVMEAQACRLPRKQRDKLLRRLMPDRRDREKQLLAQLTTAASTV